MKIEEHVPLALLTTFKVGGPARYVLTLESEDDVAHAVQFARAQGLPLIPLGGGSNVLAPDEPLHAVVVRVGMQRSFCNGTRVCADAGASWDAVVAQTVSRGLWGIENLSAIPGTVGGAVVQNIGAYGAVLSHTLRQVKAYDIQKNQFVTFNSNECLFGYRTSVFKQMRDRYVITEVEFELSERGTPNLSYTDLAVCSNTSTPTAVRDCVTQIRAKKFPPLTDFGTAGSYFLNPIVTAPQARELQKKYPTMQVFTLPEGGIKVPLGWYFEHVLGIRGFREGNVEAWREQALVIAAHSGATAQEIKNFTKKICARARAELGIILSPEVREL